MVDKRRVFVIGLDGATWNILKPWVEDGSLKAIKKLMEEGTYGYLESTIPPITCPAWKSYSTGKNPGKFGVFFFFSLDRSRKKVIVHTPKEIKSDEIWDYLGRKGIKCGVINMPYTLPREIEGFIIAGMPFDDHDYTYPPYLEEKLKAIGYRVNPKIVFTRENLRRKREVMKDIISSRFRVAEMYINEVDFLHITIYYTDFLQHFLWKEPVLKEYWEFIDKEIGKFIEDLGEEDYVFVISDHGFAEMKKTFYINNWLIQRGYLRLRRKKVIPPAECMLRMVDKLRLRWLIQLLTPKRARVDFFMNKTFDFTSIIDWDNTKAVEIGWGAGVIYINADDVERERIKRELKEELESLRCPGGNERIMRVYEREEVYNGRFSEIAPDLILVPNPGYQVWQTIGKGLWGDCPFGHVAFHDMNGIFIAHGPDVHKGKIINAKIYDIAPTILHIFDVPIPRDMDGRVLKEIFKEDSELAKKPIRYEEDREKEKVRERIKTLKMHKKI
ncbi:MAG: alkaline phosphatase family protein [Candidatus Methanospirareceae archaeon]